MIAPFCPVWARNDVIWPSAMASPAIATREDRHAQCVAPTEREGRAGRQDHRQRQQRGWPAPAAGCTNKHCSAGSGGPLGCGTRRSGGLRMSGDARGQEEPRRRVQTSTMPATRSLPQLGRPTVDRGGPAPRRRASRPCPRSKKTSVQPPVAPPQAKRPRGDHHDRHRNQHGQCGFKYHLRSTSHPSDTRSYLGLDASGGGGSMS